MPFTRLGGPSIHPHPSPLSRFSTGERVRRRWEGETCSYLGKRLNAHLPLKPFSYTSHRKSQETLAGKHQNTIKFGNMYCRGKWETQLQKWTRGEDLLSHLCVAPVGEEIRAGQWLCQCLCLNFIIMPNIFIKPNVLSIWNFRLFHRGEF